MHSRRMAIGLSVLPDGLGEGPPLIQFGFPTRFNGLSVSGISVLMRRLIEANAGIGMLFTMWYLDTPRAGLAQVGNASP